MRLGATLTDALHAQGHDDANARAVARVIEALGGAARDLAEVIATPAAGAALGAKLGSDNSDGDQQRKLDLVAEDICRAALGGTGVGPYLSEETEGPLTLDPAGSLAVAIDPLDGSSNIEVNGVIGTIFSILPAPDLAKTDPGVAFAQTGRAQLAAGFFMYGPQTRLVLTIGAGVDVYALDRAGGVFRLVESGMTIPSGGAEYSVNASNHRYWREPVRRYIDDCCLGADGPRGANFNMRWSGSMVADAYRVLTRGGLFLYPADSRRGYEQGRLRLLYEASPVAFLTEQAGGAATDGQTSILDIPPARPHARTPLIFGAADEVEILQHNHVVATSRDARTRLGAAV
jgi:fructose-1,6-bisphosphatase I